MSLGHLGLFPPLDRRWYPLPRKPKRKFVLGEPTVCRDCGDVVGPLTRICAACHFRGWWGDFEESAER